MSSEEHRPVDVVMEGGGVSGIALVGALAVLEDRGYTWINMAGTSAGAIIAVLATAGYSASELKVIIGAMDFRLFLDNSPRWLPPKTRAAYNILAHWGVYKGDSFLAWLRSLLAAKGVHTFRDLKRGIPDRRQRYRVRVVASDVTRGRMLVLPEDIAAYGIDPDDLEVALAVRMSMSIPFFFRPVVLQAEDREGKAKVPCCVVDGGLLSNFPISLFDGQGMDDRPTFGLRLTSHRKPAVMRYRTHGLLSYAMAMIGTTISAADAHYLDTHTFLRTIEIDNLDISAVKFDLSSAQKGSLYESGAEAAREFLSTWDFDQWRRAYAEWSGRSRREILKGALERGA